MEVKPEQTFGKSPFGFPGNTNRKRVGATTKRTPHVFAQAMIYRKIEWASGLGCHKTCGAKLIGANNNPKTSNLPYPPFEEALAIVGFVKIDTT